MNIRFLEPARNELDDAISWYEMEQENLGRLFLAEVSFALKRKPYGTLFRYEDLPAEVELDRETLYKLVRSLHEFVEKRLP
jgi:hypothetical protein